MNYFLIFLSVTFFCLNSVMTRLFQAKVQRKAATIHLFQACFCLIASLLNLVSGRIFFTLSPWTVLYAVLFGILFALASYTSAECFVCGPMSLTSIVMNLSLAIPLIVSCIRYGERVTTLQQIGLVLLAITFILSALCSSEGKGKHVSGKWVFLISIGFISNGFTAVLQKQNQFIDPESGSMFLFIAYFISSLCFLLFYGIGRRHDPEKTPFRQGIRSLPSFFAVSSAAGLGSFVGNRLLGTLSTQVNAAVLYPCINGGLAIMTALASFLFFHEKLSVKKILSMIIGVTAIILLTV